jgi:hypothetical protein
MLLQGFADTPTTRTDAVAGDAVGGDGDDSWLVVASLGLFAAEDAGNEFADHVLPFNERVQCCVERADSTAKQ